MSDVPPATTVSEVLPPVHIPVFDGDVVIDTAEHEELTITVTVNELPTHVPAVGVTVYTAVPEPDGIVSVPLILA